MSPKSRPNRQRFLQDARGSVAILFGVALIPIVIGVGVAVDFGRALMMRERMQVAIDSATLAVGSWPGLNHAEMQTKAQEYFNANFPSNQLGSVSPLTLSSSGNTIEVSVSGSMPTTFMRLANIDNVSVAASTTVLIGMGKAEVALVLDNSGSMQGSKIDALKTAAGDLVDTLFDAVQNSPEQDPMKIAVVPFAAGVNVGPQYANASWMDVGNTNPYHADAQRFYGAPSATNNFTLFSSLKTSNGDPVTWGGCVESRPMPYDVTDDPASSSDPSTYFVPMFAPDEPDNWTATTSNCTPGNNCLYSGTTSSTRRFNGAPGGSRNLNNYLPDAGTPATCSSAYPTVTVTTGSPAVFTSNNHQLSIGDQIVFSTTGSLPTGLTAGTTYSVIASGFSANSFRVSTSSGNAVNASGSQSGAHQFTRVANWTCQSGNSNCGGTNNGRSEEDAFGGKSVVAPTSNPNCKYGSTTNQATVTDLTVGGIAGGPNFMCTSAPLMPLSTNKTSVKSAIGAMEAKGATGIIEGVMWGWRTLSPGEPFAEGRAYNTDNNTKVLVLMTDGQNTYYPQNHFLKSWYDIYGYVDRNHLGTTSTNSSTLTQYMNERTSQACANIKAAGVIMYTVAFQIPGDQASALDLLQQCASDDDKYFAPGTEAELLAAFNAIAMDISQLRIAR